MNDIKRKKELIRKNKITNLCKIWINNNIIISKENFLEIQETLLLQNKIMSKLDEMDNKNISNVYSEQEIDIISIFMEYIINNIESNKEYIFFAEEAIETGGIILNGKTIIENRIFILKESGFSRCECSIFLCTLNAENGVCLWSGEYDNHIYVW